MESFDQFLLDMGPAPTPKHWLGRIDVTQGYNPTNCCWTTRAEQALRRKAVRKVLWQGKPTPAALIETLPGQPLRRAILARDACGLNMENPPAGSLSAKVIWLTHCGERLPLATWSKRLGIDRTTLLARVKRGLPTEQVLHRGRLPSRKPFSTPTPAL